MHPIYTSDGIEHTPEPIPDGVFPSEFYDRLGTHLDPTLINALRSDSHNIEELKTKPPVYILMHGYGGPIDKNGTPNAESRYCIKATLELIDYWKRATASKREYCPTILVSGGTDFGNYAFYAEELIRQIHILKGDPDYTNFADIWDEGTYNRLNSDYAHAVGTGGEVEFAMNFLAGESDPNQPVISVCRLGHQSRIQNFANAHGFKLTPLTIEGILMNFRTQETIDRFMRIHPEQTDSIRGFSAAERRKATISRLLADPTEAKTLETLLRVLQKHLGGNLKDQLFRLIGQNKVEN